MNVPEQNSVPRSDPDAAHRGCRRRRRRRRFRVPFAGEINWRSPWQSFKQWIKSPVHIALFIWLLLVAAGLISFSFLAMAAALNEAFPTKSRRDEWSEIVNQILNALFTVMALYEHPKFFRHLFLLWRWRPGAELGLRKEYCKDGDPKPNERAHMVFVVMLLHITCFSQYVLCGLYWGYSRTTRPGWAANLFIAVGIVAPIVAALYTIYGPLGRVNDEETPSDEERQKQQRQEDDSKEGDLNLLKNFNRSLSCPGSANRPLKLGRTLTALAFEALIRVGEERRPLRNAELLDRALG